MADDVAPLQPKSVRASRMVATLPMVVMNKASAGGRAFQALKMRLSGTAQRTEKTHHDA
jgi:hypothetical protein